MVSILLEMVPSSLSKKITESLSIPTIGIGASTHCDGQVQVLHDLLGLFEDFSPKHAKKFIDNEKFQFGPSPIYKSTEKTVLRVRVGRIIG